MLAACASLDSKPAEEKPSFAASAEAIQVMPIGKPCTDSMADERYPTQVIIWLHGKQLNG